MKTMLVTLALIVGIVLLVPPAGAQQSSCYLSYDGVDDRTFVPYQPIFPQAVFSVTAWIRTESIELQAIVTRGEDDVTDVLPWGVGTIMGKVYVQIEEDGNLSPPLFVGSILVHDGEWHHIAATRDGSGTVVTYVDGLVDSIFLATPSPGASTEDMGLGFSYQDAGSSGPQAATIFFNGDLDEITVWDVALSTSDVDDIRLNTLPTNTSGLLGHWRFNEGSGQIAANEAAALFDATLGWSALADSTDPEWCPASTGIDDPSVLAVRSIVQQNYPNPFNPSTTIRYDLAVAGRVTVSIFDVHGVPIRQLENEVQSVGPHEVQWNGLTDNGATAASGVYFYRLTAPDITTSRRMLLLK